MVSYGASEDGQAEQTQGALRWLKGVEGDGEGWLLIDDLVDTGRTARAVRERLPKAHFATIYAKPLGRPIVDTFVREFRQEEWIYFPWDIDYRFVSPIKTRQKELGVCPVGYTEFTIGGAMFGEMKVFSGSSHPDLASGIATHMGMPLGRLKVTRFSNENIKVKVEENVREADVFVIQSSCPPVSDNLMELLILIDALKFASAARITAVLPYFPYARSDKKDEARISITARLVADLLETAGADRVLTMTLHAPQILGFFRKPADQLLATPILSNYFKTKDLSNTTVVATDAGAAKFAGHFAKRLSVPMAIIDKRRFDDSEKAQSVALIGDVKNRDAIIYDDEIATGGSIKEAARILRELGARSVRVGVTHPVFSGSALETLNSANLDELVVTDSIPVSPERARQLPNLKVLSTAALFGDAILRIHGGRSISEMMD